MISTGRPEYATKRRPQAGTMSAAVLVRAGHFERAQVPIPEPGPGQVRLRLEGCGVCASNLDPWEGRPWFSYPFPAGRPGHEGWGVVDAVGAGVELWSGGERVTFLSDDAYADYALAAAEHAVALPPALGDDPFPGEPLACAMNVFTRAGIAPGSTVAVVGIGFLGAVLVELAARAGARVLAISRRPCALDTARARGADAVFIGPQPEAAGLVKEATAGRLCDVVIEATGKQEPLDLAAQITRARGRLVIAGYHQDGPRRVDMQLWNWRGIDVINAHERDPRVYVAGLQSAVAAVVSGRIHPQPLLTRFSGWEMLDHALALTRDKPTDFFKAVILP